MIGSLNTPNPSVLLEGAAVSQTVIDGLCRGGIRLHEACRANLAQPVQ